MSQPLSAASKKRLDEKNSKLVREQAALPGNRHCVECGQRGPTYVDITTCSFCCSTCSGVLRGLNPPHRIKSISMAVFTTEEVAKLKEGGNEESNKTWLGMYSGPSERNFQTKEERSRFIQDKYEKKTWFVSAEEVERQRQLIDRAREARSEQLRSPQQKNVDLFSSDPLSSFSAGPPPSISLDSVFSPPHPTKLAGMPIPNADRSTTQEAFSPPSFMAPPPPFPSFSTPSSNTFSPPKPSQQAFAFSAAPAQPTPFTQAASHGQHHNVDSLFADFDEKFGGSTGRGGAAEGSLLDGLVAPPIKNSATVGAFGAQPTAASSMPKSMTLSNATLPADPFASISSPFPVAPLSADPPSQAAPVTVVQEQKPPPVMQNSEADKYSALAELDELFHGTSLSGAGDTKEAKLAWVPSGFSAPAPPVSSAFNNGVSKSSTMGALSATAAPAPFSAISPLGVSVSGGPTAQQHHAFSHMNLAANPFYTPSSTPGGYTTVGGAYGMPQTGGVAMGVAPPAAANPFALTPLMHQAAVPPVYPQHQPPTNANPFWNPFLS